MSNQMTTKSGNVPEPNGKGSRAKGRQNPSSALDVAHRRAVRKRLEAVLDRECRTALGKALELAERGRKPPIHYDVRAAEGRVMVQRRFTLVAALICEELFGGGPIASHWVVEPRRRGTPPDFVHEWPDAAARSTADSTPPPPEGEERT